MSAHEPLATLHLDTGRWRAECTLGCCREIPARYGSRLHATQEEALDAARELVRLAENGPDETPNPAAYADVTRARQDEARDIETVHGTNGTGTYRRCPDCGLLQAVLEVSEEQIGYEEQAREVLAWHLACGHTDETPLPAGRAAS